MAEERSFRPTLLVGVGGTGCDVAERVFRRARATAQEQAGRIGVLGFDTDANDIGRLRAIEQRSRIQLSSTDTLYQILSKHSEVESSFCLTRDQLPDTLLNMRLIDGAAQIRMLSHLALYTALKSGTIQHRVGDVLAQLGRHDSRTGFEGVVNILITGSFAGATGSGSFLQIALLLRRIAQDRAIRVSVRGVFMLPDVFVRAASLPPGQIDNVLANGYASLKELNGVVARAERQQAARSLVYEFGPGMVLRDGEIPFQSVTLIDFENSAGGNLGSSIDNYKEMVARAAYQQIFTPIGERIVSVTINDAQAKLAAAGANTSNMYAGVGISAVVYPAEAVADYLALRLAREVLSGDWLRLDRMYIDRVRRYEEQRAAGNLTARLIDRGDAYLEDLDQLAIRERIAFFAEMREHLRPKILNEDREEVEAPLHVTYLDALLRHVIDTFWSTERLKELRDRPAVDSSSFRNLSRLEALVRKSEQMLDDDLRAVETNLFQRPEDLFVNILSTEDDLTEAELKDYHLQSYTMKGGPHPVQVRAFLYAVAKEAARRRDTIDLDQLRKAALKAGAVFDDQAPAAGGDDSVRSNPRILEKARRFANQGILDRLTGKAGSFIGEYARYFNVSLNHIRRLAEAAVTYKVLNLLLQEVGALAQTYAGLFTEAGRVLERLVDEVRREEERHTARGGAFSGNLFIYADPDSKRQAWEDLRLRIAGLRQTEAANTALNRAVFQKHRSHRKQRSEVDFRALRQVFETTVIEEFAISAVRKDLAPVWSFSVIEAAKREAALNRGDWRERLKLAVDLVARQAEPFLELDDINRGQAIIFWAISPTIREEYNDSATFDALFTLKQGEQPYEREEFSDRELLCVNNRVNLELRHLAKLNPGGLQTANVNETPRGRYRGAYADRIARLIDEEIAARSIGGGRRFAATVTPHIHRDWHRCGQLPEIFPESQRRERLALARAFLVALGLGLLQREIDYGRSVTNFSTVGRSGRAGIRERFAETHSLWEVYRAFAERADLVRATLDVWAGEKAALAADVPLDRHQPLIDMAGAEAVKRILEIGAPRTEIEERELVCRDLFAARYLLVVDVADAVLPHLDTPGRRDLVEAFETATAAEAFDSFRRRQGLREETLRSLRDVHAEGTKDGRLDSTAR